MANSIPGIGGSSSSAQVDLLETSRAAQQSVQSTPQSASDPASPASVGEATSLSILGSFIATVAKLAGSQSSIRPDKVASLKAQITAGTYRPDPDAVAARVAAAFKS
jgi:flagellar biosynthesis anti-sigma factor FlgM